MRDEFCFVEQTPSRHPGCLVGRLFTFSGSLRSPAARTSHEKFPGRLCYRYHRTHRPVSFQASLYRTSHQQDPSRMSARIKKWTPPRFKSLRDFIGMSYWQRRTRERQQVTPARESSNHRRNSHLLPRQLTSSIRIRNRNRAERACFACPLGDLCFSSTDRNHHES